MFCLYAFLLMYSSFTLHGATVEANELIVIEFEDLKRNALADGDKELAAKYQNIIKGAQSTVGETFTFEDGTKIGIIAGSITALTTLGIFMLIDQKLSSRIKPDIGSSVLFGLCSFIGILFIVVYYLTSSIFYSKLVENFWIIAFIVVDSFALTLVVYLYILLNRRFEDFDGKKNGGENFRKSIELEDKAWIQIFQISTGAILVLVFGVYIGTAVDTPEIRIQLNSAHFYGILTFLVYAVGLILFGLLFGILGRILWYHGKLVDILKD